MEVWLDIEVVLCTIDRIYINWKVRSKLESGKYDVMAWKVRFLDECVSSMHGYEKVLVDWSNAIANARIQSLTLLASIYFNDIIWW
jgi:hypothetical protein